MVKKSYSHGAVISLIMNVVSGFTSTNAAIPPFGARNVIESTFFIPLHPAILRMNGPLPVSVGAPE